MSEVKRSLKSYCFWLPVLLISFVLGVVGIQVVLIAHTHKMITGQPLLQGQDHHDLSHLPPLFLSPSPLGKGSPVIVSTDEGWESLVIVPFLTLREDVNSYIVQMDAPGLVPGNIDIRLQGRDLSIQSCFASSESVTSSLFKTAAFWERRVRLPGPVSTTGPPVPQFHAPGRLRIVVQKAEPPPGAETGMTML